MKPRDAKRAKLSNNTRRKIDDDNSKDEAVIKSMERKLGLTKKRKNAGRAKVWSDFEFGDLMEWTEEFETKDLTKTVKVGKKRGNVDDLLNDEDKGIAEKEVNGNRSGSGEEEELRDESGSENDDSGSDSGSDNASENAFENESDIGSDMGSEKEGEVEAANETELNIQDKAKTSEPPAKYIPPHLRNKTSTPDETNPSETTSTTEAPPTKYIPPHLRNRPKEDIYGNIIEPINSNNTEPADSSIKPLQPLQPTNVELTSPEYLSIKRQINQILNKITEKNLSPMSTQIYEIFNKKPRALVRSAINNIIFSSLVDSKAPVPQKLASDVTLLVTVLHTKIGISLTASLVEGLVVRTDKYLKGCLESGTEKSKFDEFDKRANNALKLLFSLFSYQVVQVKLVKHCLDFLMENVNEKTLELLLMSLKLVGFDLRKRNAVICKEVLEKIPGLKEKLENNKDLGSTRLNFLIETVSAIKSNNVRKVSDYDFEAEDRRKKLIKSITGGTTSIPDVAWNEFLEAESQGRWWMVGSKWLGKQANAENGENEENHDKSSDKNKTGIINPEMEAIAKKNKMNTPLRKNIFASLVASDDFEEAYENMVLLAHKYKNVSKQILSKDIISVIIHCYFKEKKVNSFYTNVIGKLCTSGKGSRTFLISLRTTVWDKIKLIDDSSLKKPIDVSRLVSFLKELSFGRFDCLNLGVMKNFDFTELGKKEEVFVKRYLKVLNKEDVGIVRGLVERSKFGSNEGMSNLRKSLMIFVNHFVEGEDLSRLKVCLEGASDDFGL